MSDTDPIEPIDLPAEAAPALAEDVAPSLPAQLRVLVDLSLPDDHPDAPGIWPAGTVIEALHLTPDHIPLLIERGIVDAAPEPTPDAPVA